MGGDQRSANLGFEFDRLLSGTTFAPQLYCCSMEDLPVARGFWMRYHFVVGCQWKSLKRNFALLCISRAST